MRQNKPLGIRWIERELRKFLSVNLDAKINNTQCAFTYNQGFKLFLERKLPRSIRFYKKHHLETLWHKWYTTVETWTQYVYD